MKTKFFITLLAAVSISFGAWAGDANTVTIDTEKSSVAWEGKKVSGAHDGLVNLSEGSLIFEGDALTGGSFVIDMSSISVTDIKDEKTNARLVAHLKNSDFFSTEEFPIAKFVVTGSEKAGENTQTVTGNLTIKGITHPSKFEAVMAEEDGKMTATATIEVDRTLYDVRYGSKKFFDNLGNKAIYDIFTMNVKLVAE